MSQLPSPPNAGNAVQQLAQQFMAIMTTVLATVDTTVLDIARLAYITVLMVGLLLYYTHIERRLGRDLIKGGVVLAVLAELVFPYLTKL